MDGLRRAGLEIASEQASATAKPETLDIETALTNPPGDVGYSEILVGPRR